MLGKRLYLAGYRVHHGLFGAGLVALGVAFMLHDRRDWREWLRLIEG